MKIEIDLFYFFADFKDKEIICVTMNFQNISGFLFLTMIYMDMKCLVHKLHSIIFSKDL